MGLIRALVQRSPRATAAAVPRALRGSLGRGRGGLSVADHRTIGMAVVAGAITVTVVALEVGRVWRRGSAPLPRETGETGELLHAAEEAVTETVEAALLGYRQVSRRENAVFNLLASFVGSFLLARGVAALLRGRRTVGPFRDVRVGGRHIHHFIPGIALAFVSGSAGFFTRDERMRPRFALAFGSGMGLTLDESALLLELDDVYWTREGVLSVQITLAVTALIGALALALRFTRRGERLVLPGES